MMFEREAWPIEQEDAAEYSTSYGSFVFGYSTHPESGSSTKRIRCPLRL